MFEISYLLLISFWVHTRTHQPWLKLQKCASARERERTTYIHSCMHHFLCVFICLLCLFCSFFFVYFWCFRWADEVKKKASTSKCSCFSLSDAFFFSSLEKVVSAQNRRHGDHQKANRIYKCECVCVHVCVCETSNESVEKSSCAHRMGLCVCA